RLMIVDPVHPVPVIEQRRRSAGPVRQESVEPSVQSRRKGGVILVKVHEIGGALEVKLVSPLLQAASRPRLGELLPGKVENEDPPFVPERQPIGEGLIPYG